MKKSLIVQLLFMGLVLCGIFSCQLNGYLEGVSEPDNREIKKEAYYPIPDTTLSNTQYLNYISGIYWCARDLGESPVGNHHFITIIYENENQAKMFAARYGIVYQVTVNKAGLKIPFTTVGGFSDNGTPILAHIQAYYNVVDDVRSVNEVINPPVYNTGLWDFDFEGHFISSSLTSYNITENLMDALFQKINNFVKKYNNPLIERVDFGILSQNCACFANTLFKALGVSDSNRKANSNFYGVDMAENELFDTGYFEKIVYGDVTGDGSITSADATAILQYVVGLITLTPQQLYAADVNNDGTVGSLDAAWVLYYAVNGTWPTMAKAQAVAGTVDFGKFTNENGVIRIPVTAANTSGVISLSAEVNIGSQLEFKGVKANLPEGWQVVSNMQNGVLKLAMAGLKPLTDGTLALIEVGLSNKEASVTIDGNIKVNDAMSTTLQPINVREIPTDFSLSQNYPNPFNPTTNIKYAIPQDSRVNLVVYNILGQVVRTLVDQEQQAGYYNIQWDGNNNYGSKVASGIYIYRIQAGNYSRTIKMNLIK